MSYDIYLKEPVTGEVANVPGYLMIGGTYKADYHQETGTFTPALNKEATIQDKLLKEMNNIPRYAIICLVKYK